MSITYNVKPGDTFETVARAVYGDDSRASLIKQANPGSSETLLPGTVLITPEISRRISKQIPSDSIDEVAVIIDGDRFRFWDSVSINRSLDTFDTFQLSAPFEPEFREVFKPFSFKRAEIYAGGTPLFTGIMIGVDVGLEAGRRTFNISGYSLPGVLHDCTPPASAFPLEFSDQGLRDIATTLTEPFGISVDFTPDQGSVFDRVACEPGQKVFSFLSKLSKQRNLVLGSTEDGNLSFKVPIDKGSPVAVLRQGESPLVSVQASFNPQEFFSHVTGLEPVTVGRLPGAQYTVKNDRLVAPLRPFTYTVNDTKDADLKQAVENKISRMYGNAVSFTVEVDTWRDPSGALWSPNTIISLDAPGAMVYKETKLLLRSVRFNRNESGETAEMDLVLPGSLSGKIPDSLPWDD